MGARVFNFEIMKENDTGGAHWFKKYWQRQGRKFFVPDWDKNISIIINN